MRLEFTLVALCFGLGYAAPAPTPPPVIELDGSGTTNPSKFFWQIMDLFQARAKPPVKMTYRAVGSGTGQEEFIGAANAFMPGDQDFGSGDIPIGTSDYNTLVTTNSKPILHFPFQLGAMSIFHNVPGVPKSGPNALKLTACLIAKIFKRSIKKWNDNEITALNPSLNLPDVNIEVFHRVKGSSTTAGVTTYLNTACPAEWGISLVGKTIAWPDDTNNAYGSGDMSKQISQTPYAIGYIDSGHGHEDGLAEISLENKGGVSQTSLEAGPAGIAAAADAAIAAGNMPSDASEDFGSVSLHNQAGLTTWPIVAISYIYLRKDQTQQGDKACLLKAYLQFIISAEGQALLPAYGAVGIGAQVIAVAQDAIDKLDMPNSPACTAWRFENTTVQPVVGQEDFVISEKRRDFGEYDRSQLEAAVTALTARLEEVEASKFTLLDGSGTTNPSKFFWEVISLFEARAKPPVKMTYRAVGSGTGQYEFIGESNGMLPMDQDFGSGDIPIGSDDYTNLTNAGKTILHFPFQMGAMSIFHNVPGVPKSGTGALKLTACLIAKIFRREIKTWDDTAIMALNPSLTVPAGQNIEVFHRVSGSSTTGGVTTYLRAACPNEWPEIMVGKQIAWPTDTNEAYGSGQMSSKISGTPYAIGYIDSGHGHEDNLAEISLENKGGTSQTSLEAGSAGIGAAASEAITAGVMPSSPSADFSQVSLHNQNGVTTWPIVAISYVYLRKDLTPLGDRACLLKAFLEFIISDEGQALLPAYGAVGIPAAVKTLAQSAIDGLTMPVCKAWSFETSTTLKGIGQADNVISAKRRSYGEYDRGELENSLSTLMNRVELLEGTKLTVLDGSGTTNPSKFFWEVIDRFEARAKPPVKMTYRAVGSGTGQFEFIGASNTYNPLDQDFGSGDIPIGNSDYVALTNAGHSIMHVPFQMGAMSIFHNVPGIAKTGPDALKLNACLIAKIFKREIKEWDHADIIALNPSLNVPAGQNIEVFHRVEGSSTTGGVTTYLREACPDDWPASMVDKKITWPADTNDAYGSGGMSAKISSTPYAIGYIDSGHGHEDGLAEISLANKDGTSQTSLEAGAAGIGAAATAAIAANVMPTDPTQDFSAVSLHNQAGAITWPIVAISYVYVRKDQTMNGDRACLLKAFLEYIISDEGQGLLPAYGAVGIPTEVKTLAKSAIDGLDMPVCKVWNFENSTTKKGVGQADMVISQKRRSYGEYDRNELETSMTALMNRVELLENSKIYRLDGSGTTNPSKLFWEVIDLFEARAKPPVKMTYRAVGSGTGQHEFIGAANAYDPHNQDFGSGDIPIGNDDYTALNNAGKVVMHFPFQMGAMSIFHNIPGVAKTGAGALKVTPCIVAKIFRRVIKTWDDPEIMTENPGLNVPQGQNIFVYHRKLGSSTTGGVTAYLHAACPNEWAGTLVGKTIAWPSDTYEAEGSGGMASKIAAKEYSIGYIDSGHGHDENLKEISLKNKDGTYQTSLDAGAAGIGAAATAAITAGVMPATPTGDFSAVSLHNQAGATTWPIVAISYVYLREDLTPLGDRACLLKAFLEFLISNEGQGMLPAYGAVGVPAQVKSIAQAAIDNVKMPVCTAWAFETSTNEGSGQADHVISLKRRDFAEYDRSRIEASSGSSDAQKIADLETLVNTLKQSLNNVQSNTGTGTGTGSGGHAAHDESDNSLPVVAIIISIAAIIVSTFGLGATVYAVKKSSTPSNVPYNPSPAVYGAPVNAPVGTPVNGGGPSPRDPEKPRQQAAAEAAAAQEVGQSDGNATV